MDGQQKVIKEKFVEDDLALYGNFLNYSWARATCNRVSGTRLEGAFDGLCASWKEAASFHSFPHLVIEHTIAVLGGYLNGRGDTLPRFVTALKAEFDVGVGASLSHMKWKQVHELIDAAYRREATPQDDILHAARRQLWQNLVSSPESQFGIWGSQSQAYTALFFAYEWFVTSTYRLLTGDDKGRPSHDRFWERLAEKLGADARATFWDDPPVKVAQLTRHSIAHTGGRAKEELVAMSPPITVINGEISIGPTDNRQLYDLLRAKVSQLIGESLPKL